MEPQTTPPPSDQPSSADTPPAPQTPPAVTPGSPKKRWLWPVVVVVLVAVGLTAFLLLKSSGDTPAKQNQKSGSPTSPAYGHIQVGDFRYVNACQAFTAADQAKLFGGVSPSSLVEATFAENTLPTDVIEAGQGKVVSSCSRTFGSDTPYADTALTFQIDQYPTPQAAQKDFDAFGVSQADLDKANERFGGNLQNSTAPLPGAKNTLYDPNGDISYTLDGNKIISFSAVLAQVTPEQFQQAIIEALPTVLQHVHNGELEQEITPDTSPGTKIGDATYVNPCKFYTDTDFKTITGHPDNPADVQLTYSYAAATYLFDDTSKGAANNDCTRYSYPSSGSGMSLNAELQYFKTSADASATIQQNFTRRSSEDGQTLQQVPGVGEYAYYRRTEVGSGLTYLDVQKGPYILELSMHTSGVPTAKDYTKAASVLLPRLK